MTVIPRRSQTVQTRKKWKRLTAASRRRRAERERRAVKKKPGMKVAAQ